MDNGRPIVTGRVGGWNEIARRKRVATSEWDGHGLEHMVMAIIVDGWATKTNMQGVYDSLVAMGVKRAGAPAPPVVRVTGNVPGTATPWVVEAIDPGDAIVGAAGELYRQSATVTLMEFNPTAVLARASAADGKPSHYTLHTVKKGQTLASISVLYYGTPHKWRLIGNANTPRIRDPRTALRVGRVLRIP